MRRRGSPTRGVGNETSVHQPFPASPKGQQDSLLLVAGRTLLEARGPRPGRGATGHLRDAHTGLKAAIGWVLLGAAWQRCRVISCATSWLGAQGLRGDGRGDDPDHLRPAHLGRRS